MASSQPSDKPAKNILKALCEKLVEGKNYITIESLMKSTIKAKDESQVITFLQKYPSLFCVSQKQCGPNLLWTVEPKTDVQLCDQHTESAGSCMGSCEDLHICKFYLSGKDGCKRPDVGKKSCHYLHDLYSDHNFSVLQSNLLDELEEDELRLLFQHSAKPVTKHTVPITCKFYNAGPSGCQNGSSCPFLHLCSHYITGDCKYQMRPTGCKRSHDLYSPQTKAILHKFGMDPPQMSSTETLAILRKSLINAGVQISSSTSAAPLSPRGGAGPFPGGAWSYPGGAGPYSGGARSYPGGARPKTQPRPALDLSYLPPSLVPSQLSPSTDDDKSVTDFCSFFLKGKCRFGDSCHNFHPSSHLPYQWQVTSPMSNGQEWLDVGLDVNNDLETDYCKPDSSTHKFWIDGRYLYTIEFDSITLLTGPSNSKIRRLSTRSSEETEEIRRRSLATEWKWYWKDNDGSWKEYGSRVHGENREASNVTSSDLEKKYIASKYDVFEFATNSFEYMMDFNKMEQRNKHIKTRRPVRRRPVLVTRETLPEKIKEAGEKARQQATVNDIVPKTWTPMSPSTDMFCKVRVHLDQSPSEFAEIEKLVLSSLDAVRKSLGVKAIYRIQNLELLEQFESKKKWMMKKLSSPGSSLERRLFHGTRQKYGDAICQQGFDFRVSGMSTGTKFGKGSYFSASAAYSLKYSDSNELFVARVLTGDFTKGDSSFTRPPPKDKRNQTPYLFDSCVDQISNPTMFIIFDLAQAYPEYIVQLY